MNFNLEDTEWTEVEDLTADTNYYLQAKRVTNVGMISEDILFAQSSTAPEEDYEGIIGSDFKFKKGTDKVYIRAVGVGVNIQIEELA